MWQMSMTFNKNQPNWHTLSQFDEIAIFVKLPFCFAKLSKFDKLVKFATVVKIWQTCQALNTYQKSSKIINWSDVLMVILMDLATFRRFNESIEIYKVVRLYSIWHVAMVYLCTYIHTYMHIRIYIYIYTCTSIHIHMYMCTCIHIHIHTRTYI